MGETESCNTCIYWLENKDREIGLCDYLGGEWFGYLMDKDSVCEDYYGVEKKGDYRNRQ